MTGFARGTLRSASIPAEGRILPCADLLGGEMAYPLSGPRVRLRARPAKVCLAGHANVRCVAGWEHRFKRRHAFGDVAQGKSASALQSGGVVSRNSAAGYPWLRHLYICRLRQSFSRASKFGSCRRSADLHRPEVAMRCLTER